eukprot:TRINITY_DN171_c0_g1_i1.p1 TRINITY_DN171_c0_g1~~TRINITY_DN171_c0_g1_i1.p1  ORF type:complete len:235 (-),score=69.13 TRINITY_DN171_c0_g1_i1:36-710(-)
MDPEEVDDYSSESDVPFSDESDTENDKQEEKKLFQDEDSFLASITADIIESKPTTSRRIKRGGHRSITPDIQREPSIEYDEDDIDDDEDDEDEDEDGETNQQKRIKKNIQAIRRKEQQKRKKDRIKEETIHRLLHRKSGKTRQLEKEAKILLQKQRQTINAPSLYRSDDKQSTVYIKEYEENWKRPTLVDSCACCGFEKAKYRCKIEDEIKFYCCKECYQHLKT